MASAPRTTQAPVSFGLDRLRGKVAIVTGSGNGFGESIAKAFASEKCKVIVADILDDQGKRVVSEITSKEGDDAAHFVHFDCTKRESWTSLLAETLTRFGSLEILVNNAGTTYHRKPSADVSESDYAKMMAVNCDSVFLSASVIIPYFVKAGYGVILNTSSTAGLHAPQGQVLYAGSKAFVNTVTQGLAAEYGPSGIRVNALCPVRGITRMTETFSGKPDTEAERERFAGLIPMRRMLDHGDIANTAIWLASDEASFISGVCVPIDGGFGCV